MEGIDVGRPDRRAVSRRRRLERSLARSLASCLCVAVCAAGCRASGRKPLPPAAPRATTVIAPPSPEWIHQPLSWAKLEAIAAWLEGPGKAHAPDLVIEGELELNEGRVLMTEEESREGIEAEVVQARAKAALAGFEGVLENPAASGLQKKRAETGKRAAQALLDQELPAPRAVGLALVTRDQWSALEANARRMTPAGGNWRRITVHHSAESRSPSGASSLADSSSSIRLIQKYHMQDPDKRWGDIGYHFLIDSSGRVFQGRELRWQGAHAGGENNRGNIGICMLGEFLDHGPQPAALRALDALIEDLRARYGIPRSQVFAHKELGNTACPGPALTSYLDRYAGR
jgi:hypothetical protein